MNDTATKPRAHPPTDRRAGRRTEGLVATYIHELSDRHAGARSRARSHARRLERPTAEANR
jgi:hypothetical protein